MEIDIDDECAQDSDVNHAVPADNSHNQNHISITILKSEPILMPASAILPTIDPTPAVILPSNANRMQKQGQTKKKCKKEKKNSRSNEPHQGRDIEDVVYPMVNYKLQIN